jgi:hypothetical protein
MTLSANVAAHTLHEEGVTISTPANTPAPNEQVTATSVERVVQAASSFASSSPTTRSGYNGACSKSAPCTGDITYYDTATTTSNPSSCGTPNDGHTELVLVRQRPAHGIVQVTNGGRHDGLEGRIVALSPCWRTVALVLFAVGKAKV